MNDARRFRLVLAALLCGALLICGCDEKLGSLGDEPLSFEVKISAGQTGSEQAPLDYSTADMEFQISVAALAQDGAPDHGFDGPVSLDVAPTGEPAKGQALTIELRDGRAADVPVLVRRIHGRSHIWIEDSGTEDAPGSFATGLSDAIWVSDPTILGVQQTDNHLTSPLKGDYVDVRIEQRSLVVTGVTNDGFYVTDVSEPEDAYNALFVFNHSLPQDVYQGDRLDRLSGTADEYYGFTELSFPSWRVAERDVAQPAALEIDSEILADDDWMEMYESRLIEVSDAVICPTGEDFEIYGQWAVLISDQGDCTDGSGAINVVSFASAPDFDPSAHAGERLDRLTGNLRYHEYAEPQWLIYTRGPEDIEGSY